MKKRIMIPYNLQFFADGGDEHENDSNTGSDNTDVPGDDTGIDAEAFAEIISEKDKKLEELGEEIKKLKKANADMLLRISSQQADTFDFDKAVLSADTRIISN